MLRRCSHAFACTIALLAAFAAPALAGNYRWTTSGPEPGMVFQVLVDPGDPNRIRAVSGYYDSLVFETIDRGLTWTQNQNLIYAQRLIQDPSQPGVLYTIGSGGASVGVMKTIDGGASWTPARSGLPEASVWSGLAIARSAPGTLYTILPGSGPPAQLYRTVDGAASWTLASSSIAAANVSDVQVDPTNPAIVYVVAYPNILKSTDSGATWQPLGSLSDATRLAIDPSSPATIYVATGSGVWKSIDGGAGWFPANAGIETRIVSDIALDPSNPQTIWIADSESGVIGPGVHVSKDGGQSWSPVDVGVPVYRGSAIALDPADPSRVYAGTNQGLRGSLYASPDGGTSWTPSDSGLSGYYSYGVACDASVGGTAYAISGANVFRSADAGSSWSLRGSAPFGLVSLAQSPSDSQTLYGGGVASGVAGVAKSVDGGATWNPTAAMAVTNMYQVSIAPSAADHVLAAAFEGLFGTTDGGGFWTPLLSGEMRSGAFDPIDPAILYAGLWSSTSPGDGLMRSADGGASWNPPSGLPTDHPHVLDIAIPNGDASHVYAAFGQGVYRSTDRGLTFELASGGMLPGFWPTRLAGDPSNVATLIAAGQPFPAAVPEAPGAPAAATVPTIFRTTNGADSWIPVPTFLPGFNVLDVGVSGNGRTFYASTLAGVFSFTRSFTDVPDADPFWSAVDAAAMNGVTSGCGSGRFCPTSATSRSSVAVFLLRGKNGGLFAPPPATGTVFGDVSAASPAADFIEELAREGITSGCGGGDYCPSEPVSRAGMAVLVLKTLHGADFVPPAATGTVFGDVPIGAFAADWIEELFHEGISAGCGGGNFCPDAPLSRAQASALIVRAFGLS
jgi:photosystem II stability/assembly factor-like uncharacterized protein